MKVEVGDRNGVGGLEWGWGLEWGFGIGLGDWNRVWGLGMKVEGLGVGTEMRDRNGVGGLGRGWGLV